MYVSLRQVEKGQLNQALIARLKARAMMARSDDDAKRRTTSGLQLHMQPCKLLHQAMHQDQSRQLVLLYKTNRLRKARC